RKGVFTINRKNITRDLDEIELELIESGLESIESDEEFVQIFTEFNDFGTMADALEQMKIEVKNSKLIRQPLTTKELPIDQAKEILDIEEQFEDDDDVQDVFHNLKITDELIAAMGED